MVLMTLHLILGAQDIAYRFGVSQSTVLWYFNKWINVMFTLFSSLCGTHSSEGKGDRGKKTSDHARTQDLRSIAEFQPREPRKPVEILRPPSLLCTGHRRPLSSDT